MEYQLRPLTVGQVFTESFKLYFRNFGKLMLIVLSFQAIPMIIQMLSLFQVIDLYSFSIEDSASFPQDVTSLVLFLLSTLVSSFFSLAEYCYLTAWVKNLYVGDSDTEPPFTVLKKKLGRLVLTALLMAAIIFGIVVLISLLIMIMYLIPINFDYNLIDTGGGIIAMVILVFGFTGGIIFLGISLSLAYPTVILEDIKPGKVIRRSFFLVNGERDKVFGVYFFLWMILYGIIFLGTIILGLSNPSFLTDFIDFADPTKIFSSTTGIMTFIVNFVSPLFIFPVILIYFSARVKKEDYHLNQINAQWDAVSDPDDDGTEL